MKIINFAGGRFPYQELQSIQQIFPNAEIFNNYGCTEAVPRLTVTSSTNMSAHNDIGRPLEGVELRVSSTQVFNLKVLIEH